MSVLNIISWLGVQFWILLTIIHIFFSFPENSLSSCTLCFLAVILASLTYNKYISHTGLILIPSAVGKCGPRIFKGLIYTAYIVIIGVNRGESNSPGFYHFCVLWHFIYLSFFGLLHSSFITLSMSWHSILPWGC